MAGIEVRIYNNENKVGVGEAVPPDTVTLAQEILGGATNAETVALFLKLILKAGRKALQEKGSKTIVQQSETTQANTLNAFNDDFTARWAPEPE